ncbi:MAG TPA: uracil-DNA glycosylase [Bacteroidales bacterium]|nr:uracil-DNA glycosylase [Bacteroidales bacterium]
MQIEPINPILEESWKNVLQEEFNKLYFIELKQFLQEEKKNFRIYPPGPLIFNAFNQTPFTRVKVAFIGQDPYHGPGQAHGLCFSVPEGISQPPSLVNIFKELHADLGIPVPRSGNLERWAAQGILLLNATLTVRANQAGSHQHHGWETFTDAAISQLSSLREGIIFVLWGNYAIAKKELIDTRKHPVLTAAHPSPFSANKGFFGCRHFSKINELLRSMGKDEIDWNLP